MLKPSDCFAGSVSDGTELSIVLPRSKYESLVLLVPVGEQTYAISLDGKEEEYFFAFECSDNQEWKGLHVPFVGIELEESSLYGIDGYYPPIGAMIRQDEELLVYTNSSNRLSSIRGNPISVLSDLPSCAKNEKSCFLKWQIVLGEGDEKQVLHKVEIAPHKRD